ncbi:uncharacterized protein LOC128526412 [Clarias gariepinus]|uniref:uncharacterized protein LOC128526412 n=1 Tax=Clarias gariepinus TaxID=13013 RepID=UPI00234E0A2B|nr:uncharacterized protein LOC128526412 [Clarias gariepinus]
MDDLEHSVIIAERDWESFYEESEECSIQQAWLASLDDSGLSDTDDEKNSTQEPVLDLQIEPDKPDKEPIAAALTQNEVDNCKAEIPSEGPGCSSYMKDDKRCAEKETSLNDVLSTCACLNLDSSISANDVSFPDQQNAASDMKDLREHNESRSKSCQAIGGPITSFSYVQDAGHVGSLEEETALKVSESSATPKKEKERWFVTVNDSPVIMRAKSGQKKGRKKKTSKKLVQQSLETEKERSISNNKKEEGKDRQILQNEFMQAFQTYSESISFNLHPNHIWKDVIVGSCSNQEVDLPPTKEPKKAALENLFVPKMNCTSETSSCIAKEENTSFALRFRCKDNSNVPETNPSSSVISNSPINHTEHTTTQSQTDADHQSVASKPRSPTQVTTLDYPMIDNLGHKGHKDTQDDGSRFILETLLTPTPLEKLQDQQYPTLMQEELKLDPQETQNQASQTKSLEATVGPNCPIYALSPFWNEMEKLTINDILHLRSAHSSSPMSESTITEESDDHLEDKDLLTSKHDSVHENDLMDDSADSDYFTQVDEAKHDRSSCELSNLSDFDEEFLPIFNRSRSPSPEPQHVKEQMEILRSTFIPGHEFNLNNQSESHDIHQNGITHYLYPANELYFTSSQDINGHPSEMESTWKTPVLLFDHTEDTQSMLPLSEILTKDINGAGFSDRLSSTANSCPFAPNLSICEMYDDFFSEFKFGNFLFPSTQDRTVPIFSASHSVVRDMIPEAEELDFDPDFEEDNMPIRDTTCFCSQPEMYTCPSGISNLCFAMSQRGNWSSLYSLRRIRFIGKGCIWHHKISSWTVPKETKNAITFVSRAQLLASQMQAGNKSHLQLAETRKSAVLFSEKEDFIFSIMQSDICLVCIAFASWVMKSYNSQSTDMWKAALLANVSAISAIQYMRIYGKGH